MCELQLCLPLPPSRRRLQAWESCRLVSVSCPFNATTGLASCDLGGKIPQEFNYPMNITAAKADGVRKSQTGEQPCDYSLPLFP